MSKKRAHLGRIGGGSPPGSGLTACVTGGGGDALGAAMPNVAQQVPPGPPETPLFFFILGCIATLPMRSLCRPQFLVLRAVCTTPDSGKGVSCITSSSVGCSKLGSCCAVVRLLLQPTRPKFGAIITAYLVCYNLVNAAGWCYVLAAIVAGYAADGIDSFGR